MATRQIEIKISAEGGNYIAEVQRIIDKNAQLTRSATQGAQQTVQAVNSTTQAYLRFDNSTKGLGVSLKNVGSATSVVIGQLGAIGPVANLATNALVAMTTASGPAGLALGGLAAAVGFLVYRIDQAKERLAMLAELQLAAIAREQKGLLSEQDIKRRIAVLRSEIPEIEEVKQKYAALRLELEKGEARPQAVAAVDKAQALEIAAIQKKRAEDLKKDTDQARETLLKQIETLREQTVAFTEGEEAATLYKIANLSTTDAVKKLGAEGDNLVRILRDETLALNEQKAALQRITDLNKFLADSEKAEADAKEQARVELEKEFELKAKLNALEVERLRALGLTDQAEKLELQNLINLNKERAKALDLAAESGAISRVPGEIRELSLQAEVAQTKLQQLGTVTINVGQTIANSVGDAFEGVILGTRKLADVGKALMSALVRDIGQFFVQVLIKKVGFENILLTNAQQIGPQIAGAISGGTSTGALPGSQGGGILGNIFKSIGGTGGGLLSGLGSLLSGGTFGSSFGFGSAGAGVAGPLMANGGFFSGISGAMGSGSGAFGIAGTVFNGLSTAWSAVTNYIPLLATIGTNIATVGTTVATTLTAVLDSVTTMLMNPVTWIAAIVVAVVNAVYRIIANQQERPNAKLSGIFEGVSFDETLGQFVPGAINYAIGRKSGIKNSQAAQIGESLTKRLAVLADQWVGILNIFPDFIAEDIQPALEETNKRLNQNFANLKFSPGGSRSIQQELEALSGPDGLVRFFQAFQPSIAQAMALSLQRGGIGANLEGFQAISPGWKYKQEDWDKFIEAIKDVATLTSQLGKIGAGKFLTDLDITGITGLFDQLFSVTDASTFTKAAAEIKEKLKPALDFLEQSVQQSTELFGRGIMAALDAVSQSAAQAAFLENMGAGVKDVLFKGITDAFVASAQFGDLLAPIQQTIRTFVQQAIETGQTPDIQAFRNAIFPQITDIATRAQTLAPLIDALQQLGFDFKDALKVFSTEVAEAAPAAANVTINIENYTNESDPATLARKIQELLGGRLAPQA